VPGVEPDHAGDCLHAFSPFLLWPCDGDIVRLIRRGWGGLVDITGPNDYPG
jgi:hypothetical protein